MSDPKPIRRHDTLADWNAFLKTATEPYVRGLYHVGSVEGDEDFTKTKSFDEAVKLARAGWSDGLRDLADSFRQIKAAMPGGDQMVPRFADAGDEVDVGLFLEGEPEHFVEFPMEPKRHPVVKLIVSVTASAGIKAEVIIRRGAAVVAVIDGLEAAGRRVEVIADHSVESDGEVTRSSIMIKEADEPLDRDRIAFALCHPSMLRRLCFRLHERESKAEWEARGGGMYGMPADPAPEEGAAVIGSMMFRDPRWETPESAAAAAAVIIAELSK